MSSLFGDFEHHLVGPFTLSFPAGSGVRGTLVAPSHPLSFLAFLYLVVICI